MMEEIKLPTVGRQVHYFPNGVDEHASKNNVVMLPATVMQVFGTGHLNLAVTCMNPDAPVVLRYSIHNRLQAPKKIDPDTNTEVIIGAYWEWPEIVR
jgi:hypothetical protein